MLSRRHRAFDLHGHGDRVAILGHRRELKLDAARLHVAAVGEREDERVGGGDMSIGLRHCGERQHGERERDEMAALHLSVSRNATTSSISSGASNGLPRYCGATS